MTDAASRHIDGLREQCSGLSVEDLHSAELMGLYVARGLAAAEESGAVAARVEVGGMIIEAQFYPVDDEGEQ